MIGAEAPNSPDSSCGSGSSLGLKETRKASGRAVAGRQNGAALIPAGEKLEGDNCRGRRGTGGGVGLSSEELHELHRNDPKRAKRILANRSSAARSKVRKLRYITELESKANRLQEEATGLRVEIEKLHDKSCKLSKDNEELFGRAFNLQDQLQSSSWEHEQLMQHVTHLRVSETHFLRPRMRSVPVMRTHDVGNPFLEAPLSLAAGGLHQDVQEDHLPSLQFPCRSHTPQLPSFANVTSMFQSSGLPPNPLPLTTPAMPNIKSEPHHQMTGHEVSGGSMPSQDLRLAPDMEPALLEMLTLQVQDPELESTPKPILPPLRAYGTSQEDQSGNAFGLPTLPSLPSLDSGRSSRTDSMVQGLQSLATPPSMLLDTGRHISVSSAASSYSAYVPSQAPAHVYGGFEGATHYPLATAGRQGLARWPRHFSDPQGFSADRAFRFSEHRGLTVDRGM